MLVFLHPTMDGSYCERPVNSPLSRQLPATINPVVHPLMAAIKTVSEVTVQACASQGIAALLVVCETRVPCPNAKIFKNLCVLLGKDASRVPVVTDAINDVGILTLRKFVSLVPRPILSRKRSSLASEESIPGSIQPRISTWVRDFKIIASYCRSRMQFICAGPVHIMAVVCLSSP